MTGVLVQLKPKHADITLNALQLLRQPDEALPAGEVVRARVGGARDVGTGASV